MKVLIRHTETGLFLRVDRDWVADITEAHCFNNSVQAMEFCVANKMDHAVILLRFENPQDDIELRSFMHMVSGTPAENLGS